MPAKHKVLFYFNGRKRGWTETLFYNSSDAVHETTMKEAQKLAGIRAILLGKECEITAISVSTEGTGPDAMLRYLEGYTGDVQEKAAEPDSAVLIRCEGPAHAKWKHIFLRGYWDSAESEHGKYLMNLKPWRNKMDNYLAALIKKPWSWLSSVRASLGKITNVVMGDNDTTEFTLDANPFIVGDIGKKYRIRVTGVNGKSTANGLHVAEVTATNKFKTLKPLAVGAYRFGGKASWYTYDLVAIESAVDEKIVTRKAGAPLLESPGRRKERPRA